MKVTRTVRGEAGFKPPGEIQAWRDPAYSLIGGHYRSGKHSPRRVETMFLSFL